MLPEINGGFISLLKWANAKENEQDQAEWALESARRPHPGGDPALASFVGNLIGVVAATADSRALPVLLDDIESGAMATDAIARFGQPAFSLLTAALHATSPGSVVCGVPGPYCLDLLHLGAFIALMTMTRAEIRGRLDPGARTVLEGLITSTLSRLASGPASTAIPAIEAAGRWHEPEFETLLVAIALHSTNWVLRMNAVTSLGGYSEPGLDAVISRVAASDPRRDVRQAARAALKKMRHGQ